MLCYVMLLLKVLCHEQMNKYHIISNIILPHTKAAYAMSEFGEHIQWYKGRRPCTRFVWRPNKWM